MLHAVPPGWAQILPGYGGFRDLTSAILTCGFSRTDPLLIALAWLAGAMLVAGLLFCHNMRTARATGLLGSPADRRGRARAKE